MQAAERHRPAARTGRGLGLAAGEKAQPAYQQGQRKGGDQGMDAAFAMRFRVGGHRQPDKREDNGIEPLGKPPMEHRPEFLRLLLERRVAGIGIQQVERSRSFAYMLPPPPDSAANTERSKA